MDDRFVNLGEEVILTFLWQSGASESATVCSVISLSICYWLLKYGVLRVVCVCVCGRQGHTTAACANTYIYAFSRCFYPKRLTIVFRLYNFISMRSLGIEPTTFCAANAMLYHWATQEDTSFIPVSVTRLCSALGLELMVKLGTLLTVFSFETWSSRLW